MKKKVIIFDFDGTLADTLDVAVKIANRMSADFGYLKVKRQDVARLRQESPFAIMRQYHISPWKVPVILARGRLEFAKEIPRVALIGGISHVLESLDKKDLTLGVLTSNSAQNIKEFLKNNNLHMFDFVEGDIGIFSKKRSLLKLMKKWGYSSSEVVYVGDEIRDIAAARHAGVTSIAVSWGFNTHDFLAAHNPDFLVDHPSLLLDVLKKSAQ